MMMVNQKVKDGLSWWEYQHFLKDLDYTILGGGIVGLNTAIELKTVNPKSKVLVIDKKQLPLGASTKNAGFSCFGSISEILEDFETYGEDTCRKLIQMRWDGLSILKERVPLSKMNYKPEPGAEIFNSEEDEKYYADKLPWVNAFVSPIVTADSSFYSRICRFGFEVVNEFEGSLNPQLMMAELELLARNLGVLFLSGIEIKEINFEEKCLSTNMGLMVYNQLIVCTNGFSKVLLPEYDVQPARNQVFVTNQIPDFRLDNCYHMNKGYVYFREFGGRLLIGGGRNMDLQGESTDELGITNLISSYLKGIVSNRILPKQDFSIEHSWSGILGVGDTKMPLVKIIDDNVLVAVRMGGMGIAIGSFIGRVAASMIQSIDNSAHQLYVS